MDNEQDKTPAALEVFGQALRVAQKHLRALESIQDTEGPAGFEDIQAPAGLLTVDQFEGVRKAQNDLWKIARDQGAAGGEGTMAESSSEDLSRLAEMFEGYDEHRDKPTGRGVRAG